jgi:hypothetical protein
VADLSRKIASNGGENLQTYVAKALRRFAGKKIERPLSEIAAEDI